MNDDTTMNPAPEERHIRSFVLRQTRMTQAQELALEKLSPIYELPYRQQELDMDTIFGRQAPRILEIGFGMGHATAQIAAANPAIDYLGVEVHGPGVGALMLRIDEQALKNIRVVRKDVVLVLRDMIPAKSLDGVHVFFPDPWQKKRHHKRRLIQVEFLESLAEKVKKGGYIYLATDWADYADWMLDALNQAPSWQNRYPGFAPLQQWRPGTSFEHKGIEKAHLIQELMFECIKE